ncbi:MAG: hypothetical protein FD174_1233 [Geobacteraceae bacterium]|nr:MAG: hypothetical protein FD174_1233 [Geobacteraceae bacterium]
MKRALFATLTCICLLLPPFPAGAADPLPAKPGEPPRVESTDIATVTQGLKEALTVAADRAVRAAAKPDGYAGNKSIRIDVPGELEHLPPYFMDRGYQAQVNAFILSLNRAAEKAAPKAAPLFAAVIRELPIDNAEKIVNGGGMAATDYLRQKASEKLHAAFRPAVVTGMGEAGVLSAYREMMAKYDYESVAAFPVDQWQFDLEGYVTGRALDGLIYLMGEEEKKIRKEPAARTTDLLRKVFGPSE